MLFFPGSPLSSLLFKKNPTPKIFDPLFILGGGFLPSMFPANNFFDCGIFALPSVLTALAKSGLRKEC
jgi:hypothetical protein